MATCKKCLHYKMCAVRHKDDDSLCFFFDDRSKYVVREKGEWRQHTNASVECPACKGISAMRSNFCPNCGADMREEENG